MQEQLTPPQKPRSSWTWWLLFMALMIWNLWTFWPRSQPVVSLPYSAFLDQVKEDNVSSLQII
jgi:hypothetical protein